MLVQKMYRILEQVLPANRRMADEYLSDYSFDRLELLLRSTQSLSDTSQIDPNLSRVIEAYVASEEARLDLNLQSVAYEIDTAATVSLVTGPGRIEKVSDSFVLSPIDDSGPMIVYVPTGLSPAQTAYQVCHARYQACLRLGGVFIIDWLFECDLQCP